MHLLIIAKRPLPGFAKTRLIPAFGPDGSATLAAAALADTFDAALACHADRVVVSFDGDPTGIVPEEFEVVAQRPGGFAGRLAGAWSDAGAPGIQIGMDTPQVTGLDLDAAMAQLTVPRTDAVLGPAVDGGWWAIGFRAPEPTAFDGVPMSRHDTGSRQLDRLEELGLSTTLLPAHRDVDEADDVAIVAALFPHTRFAQAAARLLPHARVDA